MPKTTPPPGNLVLTRAARFAAAKRRIIKIVAGWPKLTDEQLDELAAIFHNGRES